MVSRRRPINQRAGSRILPRQAVQRPFSRCSGKQNRNMSAIPACRGARTPVLIGARPLHDLPSRILNSRPVESITLPILEALASRAALAQLVEHIIRNDGVRCSSHLSGTSFSNRWSKLPGRAEDGRIPAVCVCHGCKELPAIDNNSGPVQVYPKTHEQVATSSGPGNSRKRAIRDFQISITNDEPRISIFLEQTLGSHISCRQFHGQEVLNCQGVSTRKSWQERTARRGWCWMPSVTQGTLRQPA